MRIHGIVVAVNILVLRALGIGDLFTAVPALRGLRRRYPDARIMLAAPEYLSDLAALTECVDELIPVAGITEPAPTLPPADLAINLHGRGPQSTEWLADTRPHHLVAHAHPDLPWVTGPHLDERLHETHKWTRLVNWAGADADPDDLYLEPRLSSPYAGAVLIHIGAAARARRWPVQNFATVVHELAMDHKVIITGDESEREVAMQVAVQAGLPIECVVAGQVDFVTLAAAVSNARMVVCGDTGVAHLATAFRTPSVVLFGPTPPSLWGPPVSPLHRVVWAGQVGDPHGTETFDGLASIRPDAVLDAVADLNREVIHVGST